MHIDDIVRWPNVGAAWYGEYHDDSGGSSNHKYYMAVFLSDQSCAVLLYGRVRGYKLAPTYTSKIKRLASAEVVYEIFREKLKKGYSGMATVPEDVVDHLRIIVNPTTNVSQMAVHFSTTHEDVDTATATVLHAKRKVEV